MPYPEDPAARRAILDLLGSTWPHLPAAVARARTWGADWCEVSTPFVRWSGARAASIVGVIEMPLRIAGRDASVAGVHGVCTHPSSRGRGYFRDAMEEALAWIDTRFETAVLWTAEPEIYGRFAFHVRRESVFEVGPGRAASLRRLDPDDARTRARLVEALRTRAPVSDRLATREPGWHFLIDLALHGDHAPTLYDVPELDAIAVLSQDGAGVRLDDVIAPRMPPLAEVIARTGASRIAIEPDASIAARAIDHPAEDVLMVRGRWPLEAPFALAPLVRC